MYLVDTSVWIGLFRQMETPAVRQLQNIIEHNLILLHDDLDFSHMASVVKGLNLDPAT